MAAMMDLMTSFFFGALILLVGLKVEVYMGEYQRQNTTDLNAQRNCVEIGKIVEYDLFKAGYHDTPWSAMLLADTAAVKFRTDLDDDGVIDSVYYYTAPRTSTPALLNRNQILLYRKVNNQSPVTMDLGITRFNIKYYDSTGTVTAVKKNIKSIKISIDVQGNLQSVSAGGRDTVYNTVHWQQYIVPTSLYAWVKE
jgi:hypothetical protein